MCGFHVYSMIACGCVDVGTMCARLCVRGEIWEEQSRGWENKKEGGGYSHQVAHLVEVVEGGEGGEVGAVDLG